MIYFSDDVVYWALFVFNFASGVLVGKLLFQKNVNVRFTFPTVGGYQPFAKNRIKNPASPPKKP
jgi:hypothetical protein